MYCESAFLPPLRHVFSCARQPCVTEALVDLISNYFHTKNVTRLWHTLHPIHSLQSRSFSPCSKPTVISAHTSCDVIWWRWSKSNLEEWKTLASAFALMLSALRLLHLNIIPPEISSIHTSSILHSFISVFNENIMFLKAIISLIYHATHWFEKREKLHLYRSADSFSFPFLSPSTKVPAPWGDEGISAFRIFLSSLPFFSPSLFFFLALHSNTAERNHRKI